MEIKTQQGGESLLWHSAFFEAIQLELDKYSQDLQFIAEYPLTTEPLRIDVVIIKKSSDVVIEKNIASIFRKENIIEYKSPDDYVSVDDFYKVYGYACLYQSLHKVGMKDLTLTFVESHYPRKILEHLQEERGYVVEEKWPGIYIIRGDILPIQIIDNRKLSAEENIWLKDLDNKLDLPEFQRITTEIQKQGKGARIKAYLDVILKANLKSLLEAIRMSDETLTLEGIFEEAGFIEKWEARGEAKGEEKKAKDIARNMLKNGFSVEQTALLSGLDVVKVKALSDYTLRSQFATANREEGIAMALDTLVNITQDEIEYARISSLIKSQLDYQSGMVGAKREGHAEKALEIALKMKAAGRPLSEIIEFTGLPAESIEH
jgi:hypothetical protein